LTDVASDKPAAEARAPQTAAPQSDEELLERFLRTKNQPASSKTLGFRMLRVDQANRCVEIAFDARADLFANPMRQIQGGYLCAMLDECMSVACQVASGMTAVAPTLEMKTSFLRPGLPGELRGVGRVLKWGRTVAFTEGEIFDAEGRLLAKATGTAIPTPFSNYKK
jgi:uncharacterized protein (TIGR00369 family)